MAKEIKLRGQHTPDYKFEKEVRKEYQNLFRTLPKTDPVLNLTVNGNEVQGALKSMKNGKAAGMDGIFPDMITHLGPMATLWIAELMTNIKNSGEFPQEWKHAKIIAILKPGKPANEPSSYRPISLLCCMFKLLERIILNRITPLVDQHIPLSQAGFRPNRSTTEQTLALTSFIETGFDKRQKTGVVLIDLSAAYDTVWTGGLMLKLAKIIPCQKTLKLFSRMLGTRHFHVILGGSQSKTRRIKNGVPQGSVLAPTLFNIYLSDMPTTESLKLGYADDWALTHQSKDWEKLENVLSRDTTKLKEYFEHWYLRMNTTKTVSSVFHLDNRQANRALRIKVGNITIPSDPTPKYLGITLDRSLTYKGHLEGTARKIGKRNCILRKIAGTTWGSKQSVLRTTALALCYSVAEYCSPVWTRSTHAQKVDTKLRESMRVVSGCLKPTPVEWLPVTSAIAPPHLRREQSNQDWIKKIKTCEKETPLKQIYSNAPATSRLKSRKPFYHSEQKDFSLQEEWKKEWDKSTPRGGGSVQDPSRRLPGFDKANRRTWVASNRIRTGHCRTASNLHKWGLIDSPVCPKCGAAPQDTDHLVLNCPVTKLEGGYSTVDDCDVELTVWIEEHNLEM